MDRLRWYWRRLAVMSGGEMLRHLGAAPRLQALRIERMWRFRGAPACDAVRFAFCGAPAAQLPQLPYRPLTNTAVDAALEGRFGALGYPWHWEDGPLVWHRAPDTGRMWPRRFFTDIDYRSGNPHGDARVVWEPARLQGLLTLARAARQAPDRAAAAVGRLEMILTSWANFNPYLIGVHYVSAMECGLRLIAVSHAIDMSRGLLTEPETTWSRWAWLARSHAALIARRLSQYSSAGNHTIAECTALLYAALLLREEPAATAWRGRALEVLTREADRQVLPDGGGVEQAPWYHLFVLDLLGLAATLLEHFGVQVPAKITDAIERGRAFLRVFGDSPSELPTIGDGDGGCALSSDLRLSFAQPTATGPAAGRTLGDSGYTLRSAPSGMRVIFDHGPLGMPPGFGHGHADALAVTLRLGRNDLLIDPGTYAYNAGAHWRRYFRGTSAHNTVTVDGEDQAVQEGTFLWSMPFDAYLAAANGDCLLAWHDGYQRLGIRHWRGLLLRGESLLVWDYLEGEGEHQFDLHWHLGSYPRALGPIPGSMALGDGRWYLDLIGGEITMHVGELDPPLGWAASSYGNRHAIPTVRARHRGRAPHEFVTFVGPNTAGVSIETAVAVLRELRTCLPTA